MNAQNPRLRLIVMLGLLAASAIVSAAEPERPKLTWEPSRNWLSDAPTAQDSFKRLERNLGGFGQHMREIGDRFEVVHDAVSRNKYELAAFQWKEIGTAMVSGYLTRPQFQTNAEGMFLNGVFPEFKVALASGDKKKIDAMFETARQTCIACHIAEKVTFINDHPLFQKTAKLVPQK